MMFISLNIKRS